jgi:glyoxylase-like metal-dependent hydrolase (beta-lactamase superfamily II)
VEIRTYTGSGFGENAYLAVCESTGDCVAVDPGGGAATLVHDLDTDGLELGAILLTHAHLDHIEGIAEVRDFAPDVPIWLHPDDLGLYRGVVHQAAMFGLDASHQPEPTDLLTAGQTHSFGTCALRVRFTPGHAPGHVILVSEEPRIALVGDVIFQGSIGRTDLPGGDLRTLMTSIRDQVLTLPEDTVLYPGHGPPTTVAHERATNPFLLPHFGGELV